MTEIWKTIKDYPNYQISNLGRIKNNHNRILKDRIDKYGYKVIGLYKEGKMKNLFIHRLVASAFISNLDNLPQVNHINENKLDNRVENLEWCSNQYNINYGTRTKKQIKSQSIPILQFTKDGEFIRKWDSATTIKNELGFDNSFISKCCRGERKLSYGFIWKKAS